MRKLIRSSVNEPRHEKCAYMYEPAEHARSQIGLPRYKKNMSPVSIQTHWHYHKDRNRNLIMICTSDVHIPQNEFSQDKVQFIQFAASDWYERYNTEIYIFHVKCKIKHVCKNIINMLICMIYDIK